MSLFSTFNGFAGALGRALSLDFDGSSDMTVASGGLVSAIDTSDLAISFHYYATASSPTFLYLSNANILVNSNSNNVQFAVRTTGGDFGLLYSSATFALNSWHHVYLVFNHDATATDRMKMYVNGSEITSFSTDTAPDGNILDATSLGTEYLGVRDSAAGYFTGQLYQFAIWGGAANIPTIGQVYSGGAVATSALPTAGLVSLLTAQGGDVTKDDYLTPTWINNGVTYSTNVPS